MGIRKTAMERTAAIHTASGTIQPQHLPSCCQTQYCACEKIFLNVCVWTLLLETERGTVCIHHDRAPVLPWLLKAVMINSFFKCHNSSSRSSAQEMPILLCTTGKWHLLLHIAYLWNIYTSCPSAQKLSQSAFIVTAKRSLWKDIF